MRHLAPGLAAAAAALATAAALSPAADAAPQAGGVRAGAAPTGLAAPVVRVNQVGCTPRGRWSERRYGSGHPYQDFLPPALGDEASATPAVMRWRGECYAGRDEVERRVLRRP